MIFKAFLADVWGNWVRDSSGLPGQRLPKKNQLLMPLLLKSSDKITIT